MTFKSWCRDFAMKEGTWRSPTVDKYEPDKLIEALSLSLLPIRYMWEQINRY